MYCPRCGQEQISTESRFCSRCGLPLNLVTEVVNNGGTLPQLADLSENKSWLTRSNGLKFSLVWFLVITFLLVPIAAVLDAPGETVPLLAVVGFMGGILLMLSSIFFLKNKPKQILPAFSDRNSAVQNPNLSGSQQEKNALPPQQSIPANEFATQTAVSWNSHETGDLVQPPSVTEETTKLLEKDFKK